MRVFLLYYCFSFWKEKYISLSSCKYLLFIIPIFYERKKSSQLWKFCLSLCGCFYCRCIIVHSSVETSCAYFMEQQRHTSLTFSSNKWCILPCELRLGKKISEKASKCLSMQWAKYWNKIEFPRFRPILIAPQMDINL